MRLEIGMVRYEPWSGGAGCTPPSRISDCARPYSPLTPKSTPHSDSRPRGCTIISGLLELGRPCDARCKLSSRLHDWAGLSVPWSSNDGGIRESGECLERRRGGVIRGIIGSCEFFASILPLKGFVYFRHTLNVTRTRRL